MKTRFVAVLVVLIAFGLGCNATRGGTGEPGGNGESGGTETGTTAPSISAALKLATETTTAQALVVSGAKASVGQAPAEGLMSLKYYITSITICEHIDTEGTAYHNPTGCLELYAGNQQDPLYTYELDQDFAPFGDVARQSDDGFVDLIDDTSRATLNSSRTLTSDDVRSYNFGFINWYLPVKIKAEVDMGNGVIFRTADGTTSTGADRNQGPITTAGQNFTAVEEAEEAVVVLGNGGSWFRFQNPFVISQEDIDNNTQFSLDLTFNPEGLVKGYSAGLGGCGGCILVDPAGNQFFVPMLDLTPVPHKASEAVMKETYLASVNSGADNFDIRLEIYSVEGDQAQTIYGLDTATLVNPSTTTAVSPFPKVAFIATGSDGKLEFQDYRGDTGTLIDGFERLTEVDSSTTATLHCGTPSIGGFTIAGCSNGETKELTFTLTSLAALQ